MKRYNKPYIISFFLLASLFAGSCKKDFLDQKPYTSVPSVDAVNTAPDMQIALTGTYAGLRSYLIYGRTIPVFGDILADNLFVSAANSGRYLSFNSYTIVVDDADISGFWTNSYSTILRANNIINANLNTGDDVKQYKGEAYAIRALVNFNLVRSFGKPYTEDPASPGIPLVVSYDPKALPARNTVDEVYTQILSDLDQAYNSISTYKGTATISKYAALSLSAKVNLYKGDYQKAFTQAKEVITQSGFSLVNRADVAGYWITATPQGAGSKTETLFEVVSDAVNNNGGNELSAIFSQQGSAYGDLLTTRSLYELYGNDDVRKKLIVVGARPKIGGENPAFIVNKYPVVTGDYNDKKVIRLSEVYLIAAEAAYRLGQTSEALNYLNTLVTQRDASLRYTVTGPQLLQDIIKERRKELAFEGDRFYDLNRLKVDIERTSESPTGPIKYGDYRRVLPIPQSEINVNPNVKQNAGYTK